MILNTVSRIYDDLVPCRVDLSNRDIAALLETAKRFVYVIGQSREGDKNALPFAIKEEKRKSLKFAYSLIMASTSPAYIRRAFRIAGLTSTTEPETMCEIEMLITGTELSLKNVHPIVIMQTMTAFLGFSVYDEASAWLLEHFSKKTQSEELIIPGDLPEILLNGEKSNGEIAHAVRIAGPELAAATFAGCPEEVIEFIKSICFDQLGSILLDDGIKAARSRLSSDEISDAQNAFYELLESFNANISNTKMVMQNAEPEKKQTVDESLVSDVSNLILELDEKVLKSALSGLDPKIIASLIQVMQPMAHDRIFSTIASGREKKVLDVIESSAPLNQVELTRNAQLFAQKILSTVSPHSKSVQKPLVLPTKVRQLLSSILGRE
ncbi:MAG: hypothetical protein LLF89_06005 [Spirochaetaceae bacterium]|nr:hypothetical protein [Spirochaetaceae bacterium]